MKRISVGYNILQRKQDDQILLVTVGKYIDFMCTVGPIYSPVSGTLYWRHPCHALLRVLTVIDGTGIK